MKKNLLITDNQKMLERFGRLVKSEDFRNFDFEYGYSYFNSKAQLFIDENPLIKPIDVKRDILELQKYELIISLHCKQLFPPELVKSVRCINVHPGLNPFNRGWYPQVFSLVNGLPAGATIHEIDEELDHGAIICQKEVCINSWDDSYAVYCRILDAEMELLSDNLLNILSNSYSSKAPSSEGNLNLRKDFDNLCEIKLDHVGKFKDHINLLRALTHGDFANAYFIDDEKNKINVKIELNKNR